MDKRCGLVDAVILAGSPNDGPLKQSSDATYEALINIGNKPMVEYVLEALDEAPSVDKIILVGPKVLGDLFKEKMILTAEPGLDAMGSVLNGVKVLDGKKPILIVTSDIPLLKPEAVEDFIHLCWHQKGDFFYPVVSRAISECRFPGVKRTYVKIREGVFTGGNMFLVNPAIVDKCARWAEQMVRLRKSPIKLCRMLGLSFLLKFINHSLTLSQLEEKVSGLLEIEAKAIVTSYPEVGFDVDKPSDLQLISEILEKLPG